MPSAQFIICLSPVSNIYYKGTAASTVVFEHLFVVILNIYIQFRCQPNNYIKNVKLFIFSSLSLSIVVAKKLDQTNFCLKYRVSQKKVYEVNQPLLKVVNVDK